MCEKFDDIACCGARLWNSIIHSFLEVHVYCHHVCQKRSYLMQAIGLILLFFKQRLLHHSPGSWTCSSRPALCSPQISPLPAGSLRLRSSPDASSYSQSLTGGPPASLGGAANTNRNINIRSKIVFNVKTKTGNRHFFNSFLRMHCSLDMNGLHTVLNTFSIKCNWQNSALETCYIYLVKVRCWVCF